jgi:lysophospholipase L1-like esterase
MTTKNVLTVAAVAVVLLLLVFAVRLVWLGRSVSTYQSYWAQLIDSPTPDNAFIYVALGDSAAQGVGATKVENSYVYLVASEVATMTGRQVKIINLSVSGAKTADVINNQLPALERLKLSPDLVTVEIGANDIPSFDEKKFTNDFTTLLTRIPKGALVANIPSFANSRLNKLRTTAAMANDIATREIAAANVFTLVDIYTATNNLGMGDYAADYFHPSDRAYQQKWAPAFMAAYRAKNKL